MTTTARQPLAPLHLIAVERVQGLSQRECIYLLTLVASHLMACPTLDRATFLKLADEAQAVMSA